jgi:hypothetical protein
MTLTLAPRDITTPAEYVENFFYVKGKPFRFKGREYLIPLYNTRKRSTVLKFSRQTEKSTTLANKGLLYQISLPSCNLMVVEPTREQSSNFSNARYKRALVDSPMIFDRWFSDDDTIMDQVFNKRLSNGSEVYFRYAFRDAERCRGYSCDVLNIDELQDILTDHIPIIEETMAHSPYKIRMYSGTPKSFNNPMEYYWSKSTQTEWSIKCEHCRHWQFITIANIGLYHLVCEKCGKQIYPAYGQWIQHNPGALWDGFRVCHPMVPWVKWDEIIEKRNDYSPAQFSNEVLGMSFDTSEKVLTEGELRACCDENRGVLTQIPDSYFGVPMFAGVDWGKGEGKSYTTLIIGSRSLNSPNKFIVWFMKRYTGAEADPAYQIDDIYKTCMRWNCVVVGCDHGFGFLNNRLLRNKGLKNRVLEFQAAHVTRGPAIKWNTPTERFTMHRTRCLSDVIVKIKRQGFRFPAWNSFRQYSGDFLSVYEEYSDKSRMTIYDHPPDQPDDMLFSLTYAELASQVHFGYSPA